MNGGEIRHGQTPADEPKRHRGEHRDGQSAKDRTDEGAGQNLKPTEDEAGQTERQQRAAGYHYEHEGADQPGQAHVGIDARQWGDQRAGDRGQPAADPERDEADAGAVNAKSLRQILVHDDRAGSTDQVACH